MKQFAVAALVLLCSLPSANADITNPSNSGTPQFAVLSSDAVQYQLNQKAILTAAIQAQPSDPNYEFFLTATYGPSNAATPIKTTEISSSQWQSITPVLTTVGTFSWTVTVYLQNKDQAESYEASIAYYNNEIFQIQQQIQGETDPGVIATLQAQINRDQKLICQIQQELTTVRRQVEQDQLQVQVLAPSTANPRLRSALATTPPSPLMNIQLDRPFPSYMVGEALSASVFVETTVMGNDGPKENVVRVTVDQKPVGVVQIDGTHFGFGIGPFAQTDLGLHTVIVSLMVRSKAQADSIRSSITTAEARQADLQKQLDATQDPLQQAYLQQQIAQLTSQVNDLYAQLEATLYLAEGQELQYQVVLPNTPTNHKA